MAIVTKNYGNLDYLSMWREGRDERGYYMELRISEGWRKAQWLLPGDTKLTSHFPTRDAMLKVARQQGGLVPHAWGFPFMRTVYDAEGGQHRLTTLDRLGRPTVTISSVLPAKEVA